MQTLSKFLLITATFILLVATYLHPISAITQDLGRHIKTGEIIWTTKTVPPTNLYSYTYPDFPFSNHHWGSEVLFYLTYTLSGFTGTLFLTLFCSMSAFLLVYFYALKASQSATSGVATSKSSTLAAFDAVTVVSLLSLGILFERTDVRPEAFSYLFMSIFLIILFKNRTKPTRWLAALIPLELLWVNTHVYFIIGIVLIGLFFLDSLMTFFRQPKPSLPLTLSPLPLLLLFVLVSSCLATVFNPNGISGALYPFHVFDNYGYQIEENQNIFFLWEYAQKRTILFFWASVILLFGTLSIRAKHTRPIDWLLAITFTILGIQAIRNFPLFVFAIFIPVTYHLSAIFNSNVILNSFQDLKQRNHKTEMLEQVQHDKKKLGVTIILLLLFLWQIHYVLTTKPIGITTPTGASNAVDFMMKHNIRGPIFNNFDIGSYLIFRLYPKEKVFVDGRPEAYPASFFQNTYIPMQQDPKLFAKMDKKYHFNTIFFSHTDQTPWAKEFLKTIVQNKDWQPIYLDDTIIILTRKSLASPLSLTSFRPLSSSDISSLYQLFLFFQAIELPEKQIEILQQIIQNDPTDCTALSLLSQTNLPTTHIYQTRYMATCK